MCLALPLHENVCDCVSMLRVRGEISLWVEYSVSSCQQCVFSDFELMLVQGKGDFGTGALERED